MNIAFSCWYPVQALALSTAIALGSLPAQSTTIQFSLTQPRTVSAGVYDQDGVLVRTLLRNEAMAASTHVVNWDNKDDDGNSAPALSKDGQPISYTVKLLTHQIAYSWEGVVGNTSKTPFGANIHHAQFPVTSIATTGSPASSTGDQRTRLFIASGANEGGSFCRYADHSPVDSSEIGVCRFISPDITRWPYRRVPDFRIAPIYVTADSSRAYWANTLSYYPDARFVFATNLSTGSGGVANDLFEFPQSFRLFLSGGSVGANGQPICARNGQEEIIPVGQPFSNCDADRFDIPIYWPSVIDIRQKEIRNGQTWMLETTGIAAQSTGDYLLVLHGQEIQYSPKPGLNRHGMVEFAPVGANDQDIVAMFNKNTGAKVGPQGADIHLSTWGLTAPRGIAISGTTAYIICKRIDNGQWVVFPFTIGSQGLTPTIEPKSGHVGGLWWTNVFSDEPLAVGVSPDGQTVLIAVGGEAQKIIARDPLGNARWQFGESYKSGVEALESRFDFGDGGFQRAALPGSSIAFQADGTVWISEPGTRRVRRFSLLTASPWMTEVDQIMYLPRVYDSGTIRGEPSRLMVGPLEFEIDYSKVLGTPGAWKLKRNFRYYRTSESAAYSEVPTIYWANGVNSQNTIGLAATVSYASQSQVIKRTFFFALQNFAPPLLGGQQRWDLLELVKRSDGTGWIQPTGYSYLQNENDNSGFLSGDSAPVIDEFGDIRYSRLNFAAKKREYYRQQVRFTAEGDAIQVGAVDFNGQNFTVGSQLKVVSLDLPQSYILPEAATQTVRNAPGRRMPQVGELILQFNNFPIASTTGQRQNHLGAFKAPQLGGTIATKWQWKTMPDGPVFDKKGYYEIVPGVQQDNMGLNVDAFLGDLIVDYSGLYHPTGIANQFVHYDATGLPIGQFGTRGADVPAGVGPDYSAEAFAVTGYSFTLTSPDNSQYYVYHGDESIHGGVHRWKISGIPAKAYRQGVGVLGSTITVP